MATDVAPAMNGDSNLINNNNSDSQSLLQPPALPARTAKSMSAESTPVPTVDMRGHTPSFWDNLLDMLSCTAKRKSTDRSWLEDAFTVETERTRAKSEKRERTRLQILAELTDTERDYVNDLELIKTLFIEPCRAGNIFSDKEIDIVFPDIETFLKIHKEWFLPKIEEMSESGIGLGTFFVEKGKQLKFYMPYILKLDLAMEKIKQAEAKNNAFKQLLKEVAKNPEARNLDISSFLIKPFQRITKYPLLLRELEKHTKTEEERQHLERALQLLKDIAEEANERKRDHELREKVLQVQRQTGKSLVAPDRRFVGEALFYVLKGERSGSISSAGGRNGSFASDVGSVKSSGKVGHLSKNTGTLFVFTDVAVWWKKSTKRKILGAKNSFVTWQLSEPAQLEIGGDEGDDGCLLTLVTLPSRDTLKLYSEKPESRDRIVNLLLEHGAKRGGLESVMDEPELNIMATCKV